MLQKLMALLVSGAMAFAGAGAVSAAPVHSLKPVQTSQGKAPQQTPRNASPLPAGRAAGIRQAQGTAGGNDWILIGGGVAAAVLILVLVAGGGDEDSSSSTGTN